MSTELIRFPKIGILFTPTLPQIGIDFEISESAASQTMSIFLIGYTLGQLPYGPLSIRTR